MILSRSKMRRRFHELAVSDALEEIDESGRMKLNRYQALLRAPMTPGEIRAQARFEYQARLGRKVLGALCHQKEPPRAAVELLNSRFWELV